MVGVQGGLDVGVAARGAISSEPAPFQMTAKGRRAKLRALRREARSTGKAALRAAPADVRGLRTPAPAAPVFGGTIGGFAQTTSIPPDPTLAAGPHSVVAMVNRSIRVRKKNGNILFTQGLQTFYSAADNPFDPKAVYDQYIDRFWALAASRNLGAGNSSLLLALSNDNDPQTANDWTVFTFDARLNGNDNSGFWCDYPQIGVDAQAIYITCNMFDFSTPPSFQYAKIRIMTKDQFVSGPCCSWWDFWDLREGFLNLSTSFTIQPAHMFGAVAGTGEFLVNAFGGGGDDDDLRVRRITNAQRCCIPGNQTEPDLDSESHGVGSFDSPPTAGQPSGATEIDTGDTRLLYAFWKGGKLSTGQNLACNDGNDACVAFTELDVSGFGSISTINDWAFQTEGVNYYYPSVAVNVSGAKSMVYSRSSGSEFATAAFLGIPDSSVCTTCVDGPETTLAAGASTYVQLDTNNLNRWGDYHGAARDPDGVGVWVHGEFAAAQDTWGTQVGLSYENLDLAAPDTDGTRVPAANGAGWNNTNVTVQLSATDGGSGVRRITYSASGAQPISLTTVNGSFTSFVVSAEGLTTVTFFAEDNWGNVESSEILQVRIDKTDPFISCDIPDGLWHATDVSLACTASDGRSGLANPADAAFSLTTSVAVGTETANASTGSRIVCDVAGNCTTAGPIPGNMVDKKAPSISISVPAATVYTLNQVVPAVYSCADGGSGVASCAGPVAAGSPIDTSSVGAKTFTVNAADNVGNLSSGSISYTVTYAICLQYNSANPFHGRPVNITLQLCDVNGVNVSTPAVVVTATAVSPPGTLLPLGNSNPGNVFLYGSGNSSYTYLLDSKGFPPGSYQLFFTATGDPITHSAAFLKP